MSVVPKAGLSSLSLCHLEVGLDDRMKPLQIFCYLMFSIDDFGHQLLSCRGFARSSNRRRPQEQKQTVDPSNPHRSSQSSCVVWAYGLFGKHERSPGVEL